MGREGETRGDADASSSKMADPESPRGIHSLPGTADATWSSSLEFSPVKSGPMSELREMYEVGRAVGKGGYAVVYKGTRRSDGATVAIKQVDLHEMSERKRLRCLREVQLLGNLRHPGIVEMHDSFLDETKLCIVFEWAAGGDLKRFLRKNLAKGILLDEQTVWRTFRQIADAVTHMHERRVMHRDIKPANVLVTQDGRCKVADLGLGRQFGENTIAVDAKVGTPYYVRPRWSKVTRTTGAATCGASGACCTSCARCDRRSRCRAPTYTPCFAESPIHRGSPSRVTGSRTRWFRWCAR